MSSHHHTLQHCGTMAMIPVNIWFLIIYYLKLWGQSFLMMPWKGVLVVRHVTETRLGNVKKFIKYWCNLWQSLFKPAEVRIIRIQGRITLKLTKWNSAFFPSFFISTAMVHNVTAPCKVFLLTCDSEVGLFFFYIYKYFEVCLYNLTDNKVNNDDSALKLPG